MEKFQLLADKLTSKEQAILEDWIKNPFPTSVLQNYKGRNIIPDFSSEVIEFVHNTWEIREGDVFIISYPKTGKTNSAAFLTFKTVGKN